MGKHIYILIHKFLIPFCHTQVRGVFTAPGAIVDGALKTSAPIYIAAPSVAVDPPGLTVQLDADGTGYVNSSCHIQLSL